MVEFVKKYVDLLAVDDGWGYFFEEKTAVEDAGTGVLTEEDAEKVCARAYIYSEITEYVSKGDVWIWFEITGKSVPGEDREYFIDIVTVDDETGTEKRRAYYTVKGEVELKNTLMEIVKEEFA